VYTLVVGLEYGHGCVTCIYYEAVVRKIVFVCLYSCMRVYLHSISSSPPPPPSLSFSFSMSLSTHLNIFWNVSPYIGYRFVSQTHQRFEERKTRLQSFRDLKQLHDYNKKTWACCWQGVCMCLCVVCVGVSFHRRVHKSIKKHPRHTHS